MSEIEEITCKYCGCSGLFWHEHSTGWQLIDRKGQRHDCRIPKEKPYFSNLDIDEGVRKLELD